MSAVDVVGFHSSELHDFSDMYKTRTSQPVVAAPYRGFGDCGVEHDGSRRPARAQKGTVSPYVMTEIETETGHLSPGGQRPNENPYSFTASLVFIDRLERP